MMMKSSPSAGALQASVRGEEALHSTGPAQGRVLPLEMSSAELHRSPDLTLWACLSLAACNLKYPPSTSAC